MLRGLANLGFWATDVQAAGRWYADLLGIEPYFRRPEEGQPAYLEFRVGDYGHEFGLTDRPYAPGAAAPGPGGAIAYWHVDDVRAAFERLLAMGATEYDPPTERGAGFVTASVVDPFGNVLGVMENPHYLEVLGDGGRA
jgi:predicted enzyme related to lactoylglutathione lyase